MFACQLPVAPTSTTETQNTLSQRPGSGGEHSQSDRTLGLAYTNPAIGFVQSQSRNLFLMEGHLIRDQEDHTGYIEVFMQGKCGRNTETTFDIKKVIGIYGN